MNLFRNKRRPFVCGGSNERVDGGKKSLENSLLGRDSTGEVLTEKKEVEGFVVLI